MTSVACWMLEQAATRCTVCTDHNLLHLGLDQCPLFRVDQSLAVIYTWEVTLFTSGVFFG